MTDTLADLLTTAAGTDAGLQYLCENATETRLGYAELLQRASGLLALFQSRGARAGDAVILCVDHNPAFIDAFWACQLGGLIAVPVAAGYRAEQQAKLQRIVSRFESPWLFSRRKLQQARQAAGYADNALSEERVFYLEQIDALDATPQTVAVAPGDTALIQFSSGSTAEPKGVVLSHDNLLANIRAISQAAAISGRDRTLSWMPLSHDMGLIGFHLVPLFHALNQVIMDTSLFVRRPARWLEAVQVFQTTLTCSPNFGYQHWLARAWPPGDDLSLSSLRLIFNGAEPVSVTLAKRFLDSLADHGLDNKSMFPVYGLAEASLAVSFPPPGRELQAVCVERQSLRVGAAVQFCEPTSKAGLVLAALGQAVPACEVIVTDSGGASLVEDCLGQIRIRGRNVSKRYYPQTESRPAQDENGWLDSGDLGFIHEGELYVVGRQHDILYSAGQNYFPGDIEAVVAGETGLSGNKVAVCALRNADNSEDLVFVFVRHRGELEAFIPTAREVRAIIARQFGPQVEAVYPVPRLPTTTSGKLQRYKLIEAVQRGEFAELDRQLSESLAEKDTPSPVSTIEQTLLQICRQLMPEHAIDRQQNLFELGTDSLMLVRIHEDIEAQYPGKVEMTDLFDYPTTAELAAYIASRSQGSE